MRVALISKIKEALASVLPVTGIVLALALTHLVELTWQEIFVFSVSAFLLILGIGLFNLGADVAMTPMGQHMGEGLSKSRRVSVLLLVGFIMGVLITVAEPDLSVLARQVSAVIPEMSLIITVGIGVGLFLLLAIVKILIRLELSSLLLFFYLLLFALATLLIDMGKGSFLPMSFDSGGVTTGPVTVPFIMALGVGIAQTVGGKKAGENSFGLVALCSIGPVIAVLLLSIASRGALTYQIPNYGINTGLAYMGGLVLETMLDVARSLLLLFGFFFVLQCIVLKLPRWKMAQILIGLVQTFIGLVIFLVAVSVGFMPIGFKIGTALAGKSLAALVVFAFVIGMVVVLAEPAVHVLNRQVEDITSGGVTKRQMMLALSLGVGVSIGLSILRIIFGFSLLYYLIPGYLLSLALSFFVPPIYTAIAFDSGGVASGPLTSSFILPFAIGACAALKGQSQVLELAFGIVAMVAMTPLITIQSLGFKAVLSRLLRREKAMKQILKADDAEIIYFE